MRTLVIGLLVLLGAAIVSSHWLSRPGFDVSFSEPPTNALAVAPIDHAVTLARSLGGAVLLISSANEEGVSTIDINKSLSADYASPMEAYNALGYDRLRRLATTAPMFQRMAWTELAMPVDEVYPNIAAGTNFSSHAEEVGHEGDPFLFPKLSRPSSWNADVSNGSRLDYEMELCAVPLTDYTLGSEPVLGYVLCNDFTDRWLLVRDIDLDGPMGETGFPVGKGGLSRLPVGPLLVIPAGDEFYKTLELELYVDGALRQRASASDMIWPPREILAKVLEQCNAPYDLEGETVRLNDCERIPAGTLILTGTPEGVMFNVATLWAGWAYLQPGQVVKTFGTYLGALENTIVDP
jgi:2,4-diketo-3-deoxy-L-fuconate hydrolase